MQKVGKVDRTADEIFDDNVQCFNKQQNAANKLQKELNNYIRCVKGESAIFFFFFFYPHDPTQSSVSHGSCLVVILENVFMFYSEKTKNKKRSNVKFLFTLIWLDAALLVAGKTRVRADLTIYRIGSVGPGG